MLWGGRKLWELRAGQDEWGATLQETWPGKARTGPGGRPLAADRLEGRRRDVGMEGKGLLPTGCPAPSTSGLHARIQEAPLSKAKAWLVRE